MSLSMRVLVHVFDCEGQNIFLTSGNIHQKCLRLCHHFCLISSGIHHHYLALDFRGISAYSSEHLILDLKVKTDIPWNRHRYPIKFKFTPGQSNPFSSLKAQQKPHFCSNMQWQFHYQTALSFPRDLIWEYFFNQISQPIILFWSLIMWMIVHQMHGKKNKKWQKVGTIKVSCSSVHVIEIVWKRH